MTLKYESEILFDLMKRDGDDNPSSVLPYESELKEKYLQQVEGAYPKLMDYRPEWLYYNLNAHLPADFPVESVSNVTNATFENVVPYAYGNAILKGNTKYRDIDTGDILDTFDETKNLELVSVKLPVLMTTGKNLFDGEVRAGNYTNGLFVSSAGETANVNPIKVKENTNYIAKVHNYNYHAYRFSYYDEKLNFISSESTVNGFLTTPNGCHYLNFHFGMNGFQSNAEISVAEGTIALGVHESFKTNILTVNEDLELRGIDDVKDELNLMTGELTQRIGEVVLDGSENWIYHDSKTNTNVYRLSYSKLAYLDNRIICDKLPVGITGDVEKIAVSGDIGTTDIYAFYVALSITKANTLSDFKSYLSENPLTVQYQLETESVKTVDLTVTDQGDNTESIIRPIEGTMHVSTSSQTLPPLLDMSVPVEATTQNLMSFANIEEEE